jgi:CDP-diacylglycerol--serine O-phosphatidyltransferase
VLLFYYLGGKDTPSKHLLMPIVIFGVAALMVSEIRYFSFKELNIHRRHPFPVLLGLIAIVLLTIGAHQPMLFLILTGFALSGPVTWLVRFLGKRRRRGPGAPPTASAQDVPA